MPGPGRPVGRRQEHRAAGDRRPPPPRPRPGQRSATRSGSTPIGVDLAPERRGCGYLFQEYALFPHLSAWRNVAFGLDRLPRRERRAAPSRYSRASAPRARRRGAARALGRRAPACRAGAGAGAGPGGAPARRAAVGARLPHRRRDRPRAGDDARGVGLPASSSPTTSPRRRCSPRDRRHRPRPDRPEGPAAELSARPRPRSSPTSPGPRCCSAGAPPATGTTTVALDGGGEVAERRARRGRGRRRRLPVGDRPRAGRHFGPRLGDEPARRAGRLGDRGRQPGADRPARRPAAGRRGDERVGHPARARPGAEVVATWKATATRLVAR